MTNTTLLLNADPLILQALREDISSEDVTTNAVMPEKRLGTVELICKQDNCRTSGLRTYLPVIRSGHQGRVLCQGRR